ncbi:MJ0042-type zinc finger domain-containing protein [Sphingomonas sp. ASV193]|uniref:zinc-ribbon domain-containing protein n=1 Tax=Sphingomonas sp. ASV193 TaxID=3144405 RepID=UPI0032E8D508
MILTCPECETKYVVKDGAIPAGGRQVRCASCKHSWHQDPEPAAESDGEALAVGPAQAVDAGYASTVAEPPVPAMADDAPPAYADEPEQAIAHDEIADAPEPVIEESASVEQAALVDPEPVSATPIAAEPDDDWGREPVGREEWDEAPKRRWPMLLLLLLVLIAAGAAAFWFLAPDNLKARVGIASSGPTPLKIMVTTRDRQQMPSGNELVSISGRVINPSQGEQVIPPIRAELRNHDGGKLVYGWTISPPARSLPAGASASFNSAVEVPKGGDDVSLILGGNAAG